MIIYFQFFAQAPTTNCDGNQDMYRGTNTEACDYGTIGACNNDPCCNWHGPAPASCYTATCASVLDTCTVCAGCTAVNWNITDNSNCVVSANKNVTGFINISDGSINITNDACLGMCNGWYMRDTADNSNHFYMNTSTTRIKNGMCN